eukprot:6476840-Amphidinium_carterae.1
MGDVVNASSYPSAAVFLSPVVCTNSSQCHRESRTTAAVAKARSQGKEKEREKVVSRCTQTIAAPRLGEMMRSYRTISDTSSSNL